LATKDHERIEQIKDILRANGGIQDNNAMYLLISEVRSLNSRMSWGMGAISSIITILTALTIAHVLI